MLSGNEIRKLFLDYFASSEHEVVSSSSLVPHQDPTLLFTNAGMVQFKNVLTGTENIPYKRAVTSQKCVRAGGKHNDLENVGYTARHHTFFEMLGNFSFGDYFKEQAIELAWNLLTKELSIPESKLIVTVYIDDDDAFELWKKITGLNEQRILRISGSDNYWSMGATGPCGPCSEIFYDHGKHLEGGLPGTENQDGDRFVEIWNLVFMQFEQLENGTKIDLPKPSIDTGMGLERITAVMQGKHDNYDTDMFRNLILKSSEMSGEKPDGKYSVSHRIISDHLRSSCFLMSDGVMPSNEGRGYVLRRIMRRAMRHAHIMGTKEPLLWQLVSTLVEEMGVAFPELKRAEPLIKETLKLEETRFRETLSRGLGFLESAVKNLAKGSTLPGEMAFKLYDTYGFPLDLTQDALKSRGILVDQQGFDNAMQIQREAARSAWAGSGDSKTDTIWFNVRDKVDATEFVGYETQKSDGKIASIIYDNQIVTDAHEGSEISIVLNQTPFYGESGGQVGDSGYLRSATSEVYISTTQKKLGDLHVHIGKIIRGNIKVNDVVQAEIDHSVRTKLRSNHSATHLLHSVLREVLGDHVTQKGSLVDPERLRFDVSHPKPISQQELALIELKVNEQIRNNTLIKTLLMTPDQAVKNGALALFGEKYGEEVRVVSMGKSTNDVAYSTELCGGTHVVRTGDIGLFKIISEGSVSSGVRRIEALCGAEAVNHILNQDKEIRQVAIKLKISPSDLNSRIGSLLEEKKKLEREIHDIRKKLSTVDNEDKYPVKEINGIKFFSKIIHNIQPSELKSMVDDLRKDTSGIFCLITIFEEKASIVIGITSDLTDKYNAVDLVKIAVTQLGGKGGGGRKDLAQGGGPNFSSANAALESIESSLSDIN